MQDLPLDLFTAVCQHLDLHDLIRVAETCKRFRHGDGGLETAELPTKSPVVTALRGLVFPGGEQIPRTRSAGCSESWVAYLARCARQRRCREAPPSAAGTWHTLFVDAAGTLLACGHCAAVGHGDGRRATFLPTPVAAMAELRVWAVSARDAHSLALSWDGRVFSWGENFCGQLGNGDRLTRPAPALVERLEGVRGVAAAGEHSLAATHSGSVFGWGCAFESEARDALRPIIVEGFGGVRVRRVCAGTEDDVHVAFGLGEAGELFSWGDGEHGRLGHGDEEDQPSPKRVEALQGVRVSSVASGREHVLALSEDGLVYAWGCNTDRAVLGNPHAERELLPKPVEALRGVRVGSVASVASRSYAVADTGEVWAWGKGNVYTGPIDHGTDQMCPVPKPIESLRGVKVDAVAAGGTVGPEARALARADDGSVYAWGNADAAESGVLGLTGTSQVARHAVLTPRRISALRVACG
jgi:alpha-tubulin suppressor-like RCC1 family protein